MTQIKDEELAQLKERGWSDKKIADYFTKQNRPISGLRVNQRLNKYYELQGKEKPKTNRIKRINIKEEEMVKLKENGLTDKEIANYFTEQGIPVSNTYVAKTLKKYYRSLGKEKPKIERKIKRIGEEITDEELEKLKEKGLTDKAIEEYFMNKKIYISMHTVNKRLNRYYKLHGKVKPKIIKKSDIKDEELAQLKEQGWSDYLIAKYFTEQNRPISIFSVCKRLNIYYKSQGRERPKATINRKHPNPNNKKIKKYNDNLKEILMTGITIQEFISEFEQEDNKETLDNKFEKLKVLAQCSEKSNNEWKPDVNFLEIIDIIQNQSKKLKMYENNIDIYVTNGICNKGKIDLIREKIFGGNDDFMMFISLRKNLQYYKGYDTRVYNILQKRYEEKIDMYLDRLYSIEDSRRCKNVKNKNNNNLEIEEEQR